GQMNHVQAQAISGGLGEQITGNGGTPVAGAAVKIVSEATGATVNGTTDSAGTVSPARLPRRGGSAATVAPSGYPSKPLNHVTLQLGGTVSVPVFLAQESETVVVTGQRAAASTGAINESSGVIATYSAAAIQNTPTLDSSLREIVQKAPFAYV